MIHSYLRRIVPWSVVLVPLALFALLNRGTPWRGEWGWSIDYVNGSTVLTGPGTAALAAWLAADDRRRRPLTDPLRRAWAVTVIDAAAAWCLGVATLAVTGALVVAFDLTTTHGGPIRPAILLLPVVVLFLYATFGVAIGWRCPPLVAVVVAPVLAFGVGVLSAMGVTPNLLRIGPTSGSLAGLTWDRAVALGQGLAAVGFAAAFLVVCTRGLAGRSMATWLTLFGCLAVGLAAPPCSTTTVTTGSSSPTNRPRAVSVPLLRSASPRPTSAHSPRSAARSTGSRRPWTAPRRPCPNGSFSRCRPVCPLAQTECFR